jgi:hypothetical protein
MKKQLKAKDVKLVLDLPIEESLPTDVQPLPAELRKASLFNK